MCADVLGRIDHGLQGAPELHVSGDAEEDQEGKNDADGRSAAQEDVEFVADVLEVDLSIAFAVARVGVDRLSVTRAIVRLVSDAEHHRKLREEGVEHGVDVAEKRERRLVQRNEDAGEQKHEGHEKQRHRHHLVRARRRGDQETQRVVHHDRDQDQAKQCKVGGRQRIQVRHPVEHAHVQDRPDQVVRHGHGGLAPVPRAEAVCPHAQLLPQVHHGGRE
mmetsp:Transcript_2281/g.9820  ORF Transcript_2281/g.9820 Transcript_2281/m.9820 type:complete len:219 (-) Transcript_2281:1227-1883(-)